MGVVAPLASEARLQLTTPDAPLTGVMHVPCVIVADTKVLCDDKLSLMRMLVAVEGPALSRVMV